MAKTSFDDLKKELNFFSGAVSGAVRTTAFGVIAAIWAIFTADGISLQQSGLFGVPTELLVKLAFVLAGGAILTDILQYVCSYYMTSMGVDRWDVAEEEGKEVDFAYDKDNLGAIGFYLYRASFLLFPVKLVLAILSAVSFFFIAFAVTIA